MASAKVAVPTTKELLQRIESLEKIVNQMDCEAEEMGRHLEVIDNERTTFRGAIWICGKALYNEAQISDPTTSVGHYFSRLYEKTDIGGVTIFQTPLHVLCSFRMPSRRWSLYGSPKDLLALARAKGVRTGRSRESIVRGLQRHGVDIDRMDAISRAA